MKEFLLMLISYGELKSITWNGKRNSIAYIDFEKDGKVYSVSVNCEEIKTEEENNGN